MIARRNVCIGLCFAAALAGLALVERRLEREVSAQTTVMAPRYEVDPLWPKPLPNHWVLGQAIGLTIDPQDHVWIVHRDNLVGTNEAAAGANPPLASCCVTAPPVLEFDPAYTDAKLVVGTQARSSATGEGRATVMTGPNRITGSRSTTKATSGSAATSGPTRSS